MANDEPNRAHQTAVPGETDAQQRDPLEEWDAQRRRCPVDHQGGQPGEREWLVYGHPEAVEALEDHATYSSRVSAHLSVPSGMDPPEHTAFRAINDRYFTPERMARFEPACRDIVAEAVDGAVERGGGEAQADLGEPCAVRMQCAFMGWPPSMRGELTAWQDANERATRARDKVATTEVARAFEEQVGAILDERRDLGDEAPDDPTTRLLRERVDGRLLTDEETISIIRNWTVGELGSIAASIGIVLHELASDQGLQSHLRANLNLLPAAIDEILRARGPLVANRRRATRESELGGQKIARGDGLRILWPALNRDERVFEAPQEVKVERDASANLLYGTGIHYCPGAPLARLELRLFTEELLARTGKLTMEPRRSPVFATPPKGGFERVYFQVER